MENYKNKMLRISIEMAADGRCLNRFFARKRGLSFSILNFPFSIELTACFNLAGLFPFYSTFPGPADFTGPGCFYDHAGKISGMVINRDRIKTAIMTNIMANAKPSRFANFSWFIRVRFSPPR